jgi:hypothetical protein
MSWIVVTQKEIVVPRIPPEVTTYIVTTTIDQASVIPRELFVFATDTDEFSNVALVRDIESWPATKEEAIARYLDFYRKAEVTREFTIKEKAAAFAADVRRRLEAVNRDYAGETGVLFGGQHTFVYSTESR